MATYCPKRVLLVDSHEKTRELRAVILRGQRVEVDSATCFGEAMNFWKADAYNLILLAARETPQEAVAFFKWIRREAPRQKVAFLIGPPSYLSFTLAEGSLSKAIQPSPWGEKLRGLLASA